MASSLIPQKNYDVFLSFLGEDTRHNIVGHLYKALDDKGIRTFKDDRSLEYGDIISDELVKAIKTSWIAVVVVSENYATSSWCLEELRQIIELCSDDQIKVVPIFYKVDPSDVRKQRGSFEAGLQRYKDQDKVLQWKEALSQIGKMSGTTSTDEAQMVIHMVETISNLLQEINPADLINLENLVGMEEHKVKMSTLLDMESENEVRMVGIWGLGGIGKTTIAKVLYDRFSGQFQARCFIEDIDKNYKDSSLSKLQENFLYSILGGQHINLLNVDAGCREIQARLTRKKVFFVLDGVDNAEQVRALAEQKSWFGPGSRIIITTRDKDLLTSCKINNIYKVRCLDDEDALKLFEKLAYREGSSPSDEIKELSIRTAKLAQGFPSAIVAYASYFNENTSIADWEGELHILEKGPLTTKVGKLVGLDRHMKALYKLLDLNTSEVRLIGIWGLGGVGKTTLARYAYKDLYDNFHTHMFIDNAENIDDQNPETSRSQTSRVQEGSQNKKVSTTVIKSTVGARKGLLVIDCVDNLELLRTVEEIVKWCGSGSRVILITQDKNLLDQFGVEHICELKSLRYDEALQLFSISAFEREYPPACFESLLPLRAVQIASFLPLTLKILGSFLKDKNEEEWEKVLQKYEGDLEKIITEMMKKTYKREDGKDQTPSFVFK